ncbi:hypothetical protein AK95_05740 [Paenibacillus sp. LC231]|nr:hypothetical protein AK95_05740 [Paenibacillus sp. LC231]
MAFSADAMAEVGTYIKSMFYTKKANSPDSRFYSRIRAVPCFYYVRYDQWKILKGFRRRTEPIE